MDFDIMLRSVCTPSRICVGRDSGIHPSNRRHSEAYLQDHSLASMLICKIAYSSGAISRGTRAAEMLTAVIPSTAVGADGQQI